MIVQCESCRAQFDVEDVILRPSGRKLKCSQCQAVFFQPPPKSKESSNPVQVPASSNKPAAAVPDKKSAAPVVSHEKEEILKEIFHEDDGFVDDHSLSDADEILSSEEPDDGLDGLNEILPNDLFDDTLFDDAKFLQQPAMAQEVSPEEAFSGFSETFSNEVDELLEKEGLIDTYMRDEIREEPPGFQDVPEFDEEAETIVGPKAQLALAKPTKRELEQARLAQEKLDKVEQEKKVPPVIQEEKKEPFIHMEEKWDTGEPSFEEPEPESESESEDETVDAMPTGSSRKLWLLSLFLLLIAGVGLASLTDWWTYKQFDLSSSFRLSETKSEWRRYPFGMVLLVGGSVTNTSRVAHMVPGIRIVLSDQAGQEIASSVAYPGRVIDDPMLDESNDMTLRAMATLQGEDKRLKMNKLSAGSEMPFQVIFVQPSEKASRYRLQLLLSSGKESIGKEQALPVHAEAIKSSK